ncbi:MAG: LAGLIDADG family homing endonuclease, partial [Candidatus Micrarchaeota archaeon]
MEEGVSAFEDYFSEQMRDELMALAHAYPKQKSIEVDWEKFSHDNEEQAIALLETPDDGTRSAEEAVKRICQSLRPSEGKFEPHVRFYNLPLSSEVGVQFLGAEHLNKLSRVDGVVRWINQISPLMKTATWECVHCATTMKTESDKANIKPPSLCKCGHHDFKLLEESSDFINVQKAQLQESVEKLRGNAPAADIELWMEDDLANTIVPGEKVVISGILRLRQMRDKAGKRSGVYAKFLDVEHILKQEQEFEELHITKEEEKEILRLSKDPRLFEKIVQSIAPNISGYTEMKQAIALQLFGGTPGKVLPDGRKLRSDIHLLLIGDPGCLIGDERVALGNGAIVKMQDLGSSHLQPISEQVLTGQGYCRDTATVFHKYENQPVMEILTESGKCIKGTYNHPLLVVNGMKREWKRLDEMKEGDRLAVTTKIPCTITAPIATGWQALSRHLGPRSKARLPKTLDAETAALLGYVAGDGWVTRTRVAFDVNSEEEDLIPILCALAEKSFGIAPKVRREKRAGKKPITVIDIHSVDVAHNLSFLREKRVPDLVMRSGNAVASEFLAWLFEADGCVFGKGRGCRAIQLKSSEIEMLRDVQVLLLRFGIHSRINANNLCIRRAESMRKFAEKIGFRSAKKKARLAALVESVKTLQHEFGGQRSERVVLVRPAGFADVFDIEVPKGHRFIANGVISHNTAKSATLQYVSNLAPKSVYVSGASSSGVGLTASAEKEKDG